MRSTCLIYLSGLVHLLTNLMESLPNCFRGSTAWVIWSMLSTVSTLFWKVSKNLFLQSLDTRCLESFCQSLWVRHYSVHRYCSRQEKEIYNLILKLSVSCFIIRKCRLQSFVQPHICWEKLSGCCAFASDLSCHNPRRVWHKPTVRVTLVGKDTALHCSHLEHAPSHPLFSCT